MTTPPIPRSEVHVYAGEDLKSGVPGALRFTAFYRDVVHVGRFDHTDDEAVGRWIIAFAETCGTNPVALGWLFHKVEQAAQEALTERYKIDRFDDRIQALQMRANDQERELEALKAKLHRMTKSLALLREGGAK